MQQPLHTRHALEELRAVIGTEKLARLVERFVVSLREAFADDHPSAEDLAREAHTLVSVSGMLGCERLSAGCRTLEVEAKSETDLRGMLARIRTLRDETLVALADLSAAAGRSVSSD